MTEISLRLIRQTHENFSPDDIEALKEINLSNQGIQRIDNLELFTHISVLNLSGNSISQIENIDLLNNLDFLDVSGNQINSESLVSSIDLIPRSLRNINLSGNPCAADDLSLCLLQDRYPDLNIIVGVYEDGEDQEGEPDVDDYGDDEDEGGGEEDEEQHEEGPLNAEEVLRALVDRKCRLQTVETFNMGKVVDALNEECRKAIDENIAAFETRRAAHHGEQVNNNIFSIKSRVDALLKRNLDAREDANVFRERLRQTADAAMKAIKSDHK
jgi:hypothetical protein